jgi:ribulose-phosphate 3-epimerase
MAPITETPLDAHLMIVDPQKFIPQFRDLGVRSLSIHYEASLHLHRTIMEIKSAGMQAGVVLNPHTPVEVLTDILDAVDIVLIMSVDPGYSGQKFILRSYEKVRRLKKMIRSQGLNTQIEVDGGINIERGKLMVEAGADILVAGNSIFHADNPQEMIRQMKRAI